MQLHLSIQIADYPDCEFLCRRQVTVINESARVAIVIILCPISWFSPHNQKNIKENHTTDISK